MVSVQFRKNFTGPSFCGGWAKKLQGNKLYHISLLIGAFKKLYCRV